MATRVTAARLGDDPSITRDDPSSTAELFGNRSLTGDLSRAELQRGLQRNTLVAQVTTPTGTDAARTVLERIYNAPSAQPAPGVTTTATGRALNALGILGVAITYGQIIDAYDRSQRDGRSFVEDVENRVRQERMRPVEALVASPLQFTTPEQRAVLELLSRAAGAPVNGRLESGRAGQSSIILDGGIVLHPNGDLTNIPSGRTPPASSPSTPTSEPANDVYPQSPVTPPRDFNQIGLDASLSSAQELQRSEQRRIDVAWNAAAQYPLGRGYEAVPRPEVRLIYDDLNRDGRPDYARSESAREATERAYRDVTNGVVIPYNRDAANRDAGRAAVVFNRSFPGADVEVPTVYRGTLPSIVPLADGVLSSNGSYTPPRFSYSDIENAGIRGRLDSTTAAGRQAEESQFHGGTLRRIQDGALPVSLAGATSTPVPLTWNQNYLSETMAIEAARERAISSARSRNASPDNPDQRVFVIDVRSSSRIGGDSVPHEVTLTRAQAATWLQEGRLAGADFDRVGVPQTWLQQRSPDQPRQTSASATATPLPEELERFINDPRTPDRLREWQITETPTREQWREAYTHAGGRTEGIGSELRRVMLRDSGINGEPPRNDNRPVATSPGDEPDPQRQTSTQLIQEATEKAAEVDAAVRPVLDQITVAQAPPSPEERRRLIQQLRELANHPSIDAGISVGDPTLDDLARTHAHRDRNFIQGITGPLQLMDRMTDPARQSDLWARAQQAAQTWSDYRASIPLQFERVLRQGDPGFIQEQLQRDMDLHGVNVTTQGDLNATLPGYTPMSMSLLYEELAGANPSKYRDPSRSPEVRITVESENGRATRILIQDNAIPYAGGEWSPTDGRRYSPEGTTGGGTGLSGLLRQLERMSPPYTLSFGRDTSDTSLGGNVLRIEPLGERVPLSASPTPQPAASPTPSTPPPSQIRTEQPPAPTEEANLPLDERLDRLDPEQLNELKERFNVPAAVTDPDMIRTLLLFKNPSELHEAIDAINARRNAE